MSGSAASRVRALWRTVGDDFGPGWLRVREQAAVVVAAGFAESAAAAAVYVPDLLAETGVSAPAVGGLGLAALAVPPDGSPVVSWLDAAPIRAKQAVAAGMTVDVARRSAESWLVSRVLTGMADVRRNTVSVGMVQRPALAGYTRMLNPPSCSRCVILAGKWFRWNEGFQRHPACDCIHQPAKSESWARAEGFVSDPYEYFNGLSRAEQDRLFGRANAQAIRDGADIYRVENVRMRGLSMSKAGQKYGTPARMTPNDIYGLGLSRADTIRALAREGYVTGPQVTGGNILGPRYERQVSMLAREGSASRRIAEARASGVRDPLDRATMTAQERRLFDAQYRLSYAEKYGVWPRSVGLNSADEVANSVLRPVTADELQRLRDSVSNQLSKIRPGQGSMRRLVTELGLDRSEAETAAIFDQIEARMSEQFYTATRRR